MAERVGDWYDEGQIKSTRKIRWCMWKGVFGAWTQKLWVDEEGKWIQLIVWSHDILWKDVRQSQQRGDE